MKEKKLENSSRWKHRTPRLKRQGGRAAEGNCRASCCQKRFSGLWWWLRWRSAAAAPRWPNRKESGGINATMPPSSQSPVTCWCLPLTNSQRKLENKGSQWWSPQWSAMQSSKESGEGQLMGLERQRENGQLTVVALHRDVTVASLFSDYIQW